LSREELLALVSAQDKTIEALTARERGTISSHSTDSSSSSVGVG
jgi:hypothetical protein